MKNQNFGFEFEFYGITRKKAAEVIANYFNSYVSTLSYYKFGVNDSQGRTWKVVYDSSILHSNIGEQCEMVTPICSYEDIEVIQDLIRALRAAGAKVNASCAIHVHVDASGYTATALRNVANIMASKEDILVRALNIHPDRLMKYCAKADTSFINSINEIKPKTVSQLRSIWYRGIDGANEHYHNSRYRLLNLHSTFSKGTVEFRCFNGTLHAGRAKSYIQLCLAISHMALTQKSAKATKTVSTNEKFTFRTWLLRLGLIGDEFKTARKFLLEHLEGNSAWRYTA